MKESKKKRLINLGKILKKEIRIRKKEWFQRKRENIQKDRMKLKEYRIFFFKCEWGGDIKYK